MAVGGKREGAGRKRKIDEETQHELFAKAIKLITNKKGDEESQVAFIKSLAEFDRGKIWIGEKFFGKPKEKVELETGSNTIPIINFITSSKEESGD